MLTLLHGSSRPEIGARPGKRRGYAHCSFFEFEEVDEAESVADDYGLGVGEG